MLQAGSKGLAVKQLQIQLKGLGYFVGRIDGDFGLLTHKAVQKFQQDHRLKRSGTVGSLTIKALEGATDKHQADSLGAILDQVDIKDVD